MRTLLNHRTVLAALLAAICGAGTANAVDTVAAYALQNVSFSDGAVATGGFVFDLTTDALTSWQVTVNRVNFAGTVVPALNLDSRAFGNSASYPGAPALGFLLFGNAAKSNYIDLQFTDPGLAGAPASAALGTGTFERLGLPTGGTLATSLDLSQRPSALLTSLVGFVPESSTWSLMLVGLLATAATVLRRPASR